MVKSATNSDIALLGAMFLWLMATLTLACFPIFVHDGLVELWFVMCMIFGVSGFISFALAFIIR